MLVHVKRTHVHWQKVINWNNDAGRRRGARAEEPKDLHLTRGNNAIIQGFVPAL